MIPLVANLLVLTEHGQFFLVLLNLLESLEQLSVHRVDPAFSVQGFPADKSDDEDDGCGVGKDAEITREAKRINQMRVDLGLLPMLDSQIRRRPTAFEEDWISVDKEND